MEPEENNPSTQPSVEGVPKKGSKRYCELHTKIEGGEPYTRRITVDGRPYYQLCQMVYEHGKRKIKVIKHLGNRKPRRGK